MSRPVYSTDFYSGVIPTTGEILFEYDGPDTVLLRTVVVSQNQGAANSRAALGGANIYCSPGAWIFNVGLGQAVANSVWLVETRLVLPSEFAIWGQAEEDGWACMLSGYTLTPS